MSKTFTRRNFIALTATMAGLGLVGCDSRVGLGSNSSAGTPYDHYTVVFDKNTTPDDTADDETFTYYTTGWGAIQKSSVIEVEYSEDAYISSDDVPRPSRKGYYFAGWQTIPVVEDSDIENGVSKYQVFFGTKTSEFGSASTESGDDEGNAMYLRDFDTLTSDGTLTLYARWVEAKEVSTEGDLRAMSNDLYGAYLLMADIALTEPWEPIGAYYSNYENWNDSWWTYAFRGSLDGGGHAITGLVVNGAKHEAPATAETGGDVWHDDGECVEGIAGLFGAIAGANISNLTIDGATINVRGENAFSGPYCYAGVLAAFDMASTVKAVRVANSTVVVDFDDETSDAAGMFVSVAGLEAGGWSSTISDCSVDGTSVALSARAVYSHGGEVYVGGLVGECYATMKNNVVDATLLVSVTDVSSVSDDTDLSVNVGGNSAADTSTTADEVNAIISVAVYKPEGVSLVNVGGFTGSQRYMSATGNTVTAAIATDVNIDPEEGVLNAGSVMGRLDAFYATLILMYADGVTCGSSDNDTNVTLNGEPLDNLIGENGMPTIDGKPITYIATADYTAADGTVYPANISKVADAYGGSVPIDDLESRIMYISIK